MYWILCFKCLMNCTFSAMISVLLYVFHVDKSQNYICMITHRISMIKYFIYWIRIQNLKYWEDKLCLTKRNMVISFNILNDTGNTIMNIWYFITNISLDTLKMIPTSMWRISVIHSLVSISFFHYLGSAFQRFDLCIVPALLLMRALE